MYRRCIGSAQILFKKCIKDVQEAYKKCIRCTRYVSGVMRGVLQIYIHKVYNMCMRSVEGVEGV